MKKGFTLAEVLLTLAIIGVVAALTVPAVITKVTQDQYVVSLKKTYNTLKAVEQKAVQANGEMKNWDWTGTVHDFEIYFKPHFDILKDCGYDTDNGCFEDKYKKINGDGYYTVEPNIANNFYRIILSDGISVGYRYDSNTVGERVGVFIVDINGKKLPNTLGRDFFAFITYASELGIKPVGAYMDNGQIMPTETLENDCPKDAGINCATKVLAEGAMNY